MYQISDEHCSSIKSRRGLQQVMDYRTCWIALPCEKLGKVAGVRFSTDPTNLYDSQSCTPAWMSKQQRSNGWWVHQIQSTCWKVEVSGTGEALAAVLWRETGIPSRWWKNSFTSIPCYLLTTTPWNTKQDASMRGSRAYYGPQNKLWTKKLHHASNVLCTGRQ